jgi:hypothetical protein
MSFPKLSTPAEEGVLRVSKWLKFQVLLDAEEMRELLSSLKDAFIFLVSTVVDQKTASLSLQEFADKYSCYADMLKRGLVPHPADFKTVFSSILTATPDILYAQDVGHHRFLIKPVKPVIQFQAHHFFLSDVDGKYHSMVLSDESISWGLQISYPQIFQDPKESNFSKVIVSEDFPNTALFGRLTKWLRHHSVPTPFVYRGVKTCVPIRIGKKCASWIADHPQLLQRKLEVHFGS